MSNGALPETAETYLRVLGAELSDAPPATARDIVDDVRAHITDAIASGRGVDEVLAGLGSPQSVARQARDELALPEGTPDRAQRAGRTLRTVAVVVGVLTAVCVSFLLRTTVPLDPGQAGPDEQSVVQRYGPGLAMLTLLPALVAAAPFVLPARLRGTAGIVGAATLTVLTFVSGELGLYYFPLVLLLWAATIVPWAIRRRPGRATVRAWRLTAAVFVALPGLLALSSADAGRIGLEWIGVLMWGIGPLVIGALCAFGIRTGYVLAALAGAAVMIMSMIGGGFLFAAFWLFGGLYLMIGSSGAVATTASADRAGRRSALVRPAEHPAPGRKG